MGRGRRDQRTAARSRRQTSAGEGVVGNGNSDSSSTGVILGLQVDSVQRHLPCPGGVDGDCARRPPGLDLRGHRLWKTTLAARLSGITGLKWHSVDDLTWQPGWVEVPTEQQRSIIHDICQESEWILDSAYSKWLDEPLGRAEPIVALDYRRWVSLQRLVRRTIARLVDGRLICNGNRETFANSSPETRSSSGTSSRSDARAPASGSG